MADSLSVGSADGLDGRSGSWSSGRDSELISPTSTTPELEPSRIYATLLTKSSYLPGVLVLASSLAATASRYPLVVLVTPSLDAPSRSVLRAAGLLLREVPYLQPKTKKAFAAHDARFEDTWTKLSVFGLEEYERVVLLDADMLVLRSPDHLIELDLPEGHIAASHACTCNPRKLAHYPADWTPENCAHTYAQGLKPIEVTPESRPTFHLLNSGTVVLQPSRETMDALTTMLAEDPIVQSDLLAHFFKNRFQSVSYAFNALKTMRTCHAQLWRDEDVSIIHYIHAKPWAKRPAPGDDYAELDSWWWRALEKAKKEFGTEPSRNQLWNDAVQPFYAA